MKAKVTWINGRAVKLSADKYCSASKMFELSAKLEHEWKNIAA